MTFRTPDRKVEEHFHKKGTSVAIHYRPYYEGQMRFLESGDTTPGNLIVFVHGAPGSSNNFHRYLMDSTLLRRARMVSVDRLGYGYSNYGCSEPSIQAQAASIAFVIDQCRAQKVILVGHSFGGPIIAKCAADFADKVSAIVMLAPVNDPVSEKIFWFSHFARWKTTRWMLSKALIVSGDEKFAHISELENIMTDWKKIRAPVVHIHGKKDKLAPPENIEFSRREITPEQLKLVILPDSGHFIPWTDYDIVKQELFLLLE